MPGDDLSSIPGLEENHRRALADKLGITSLRALAEADQRAIYNELRNIRPRPSLGLIADWHSEARNRLSIAAINTSAWHTAASFVAIFAQRMVDGRWERRLEAEQTEVEPPAQPQQWPGWDCEPLCDWMRGQVASQMGAPTAAEPAPSAVPARAGRAELRIDGATITDALHELDLIRAGNLIAAPPEELRPPVHLSLTVSGGRPGQQLRAAVWFPRQGAPGWSPHEPVAFASSGQAEFELSSVPAGVHQIRLLAWATDPGATLAAVTLPALTFREEGEQDGDPAAAGQ